MKASKIYNYNYKGFTFSIERNYRNDNFLSLITNTNNTAYRERIIPIRQMFLTLKKAKQHAIEMIQMQAV